MVENVITGVKYAVTLLCALAVLLNLGVIARLVWTTKLRIKYYQLVFNLTLADLFFAALSLAFSWAQYHIIYSLFMTGYIASVLTILLLAMNRYLAVSLTSSRYDALVRGRRLLVACLLIWFFSTLINLLPITTGSEGVTLWIYGLFRPLTVFISWLVVAVLYGLLFFKVRKRTPFVAPSPGTDASAESSPSDTRIRRARCLLATFVIIPVASFIFWMPYSVVRMTAFVDPGHFFNHYLDIAYWFSGSLYCISALLNPLIYWGRLDGFGEGVYTQLEDLKEVEVDENDQSTTNTLI